MARMKIAMPDDWHFSTQIVVRVTDLNYGNHLGNEQFLAYAQIARVAFLEKHGFTELDFGGVSLIQADAAIIYKGEGHLNDTVTIGVAAVQEGNSSFNLFYRFTNETTSRIMAEIRTAIVCFDYEKGKPVGIPECVKKSTLFSA